MCQLLGRDDTRAGTPGLWQRSARRFACAVLDPRTAAARHQRFYAAGVRPSAEVPRHGCHHNLIRLQCLQLVHVKTRHSGQCSLEAPLAVVDISGTDATLRRRAEFEHV